MQITDMHVTPIAISDPPLLNAGGLHAPFALRAIVEIVTDDQIYGLGEVPGGAAITAALEAAREIVVGRDPFQITAMELALSERFCTQDSPASGGTAWSSRTLRRVFSAIEVACLDIVGKFVGRPIYDLLGGRVRDRVEFSAYLFFKYAGAGGAWGFDQDPDARGWAAVRQQAALDASGLVAQAKAMCHEFGFKSIKVKGGALPPEEEADAILALRDAFGPDIPLRLDPNGVWSVETAINWGRRLEGALEYYEDPVRGQEAMAQVRRALSCPLATNMCTTSFEDIPGSVGLGSEDVILSDHHVWGGLRRSMELARICQTFGRGLSMHSNSHVGISLAAMTHLAAATPNLTYACDTHYPWQCEEVIVGGQLRFAEGVLPVPEEPGLGIELDRDALAGLHAQYRACGLTERNDEVEMQKVQPDWTYQSVRW